jgi:hypothetical protein
MHHTAAADSTTDTAIDGKTASSPSQHGTPSVRTDRPNPVMMIASTEHCQRCYQQCPSHDPVSSRTLSCGEHNKTFHLPISVRA